ncbi:MAG: ABC transporter ATP-binding protein [Thermoproteota archaeon]|uniref:Molybdate/tungstate import ATP-binding protein WtpC n=2 Tax=Candidatus Methanodesulfokora washburnensis TaxID=2478471 RepID=A0A3R9X0B3_9CREN|nr:ATP-binding cassette domain-containing protein [Candidatus Methanodesulfokores washburnensis]RSN71894.1 ATP-binding cassette domain-containing protein [Candidatus Methanodesulfokores washburnensis]TDA37914.1 MAG: ABC transporter ATP-binding protein [Candidatus Korarchaeota archaeon]
MESDLMIAVKSLKKSFDNEPVVDEVSFSVRKGETLAIVGPNGAGKTTILRMIAGLIEPDQGVIEVRGRVSMVPQENLLLPWRSLRYNIGLGLKFSGMPEKERNFVVEEVADIMGIKEYLEMNPWKVSGGTARKAAIARALAIKPDVLLLDEPFTGLDIDSRKSLFLTLIKLKPRITMILVTHNMEEVNMLANRVLILTPRPARVSREILVESF